MVFLVLSIVVLLVTIIFFVVSKSLGKSTFKEDTQLASNLSWVSKITAPVAVLFFILSCFVIVPAGNVGVPEVLGNVGSPIFPGVRIVSPITSVTFFSTRVQNYTMSKVQNEGDIKGDDSLEVLSKNGSAMTMDMTVLYRINPHKASKLYRTVGEDYKNVLIRPNVRTSGRDAAGNIEAEQIYSTDRSACQVDIFNRVVASFKKLDVGIEIESVQIRNITLPQALQTAINEKVASQQKVQAMEFERQQAQRKADIQIIEAKGIAESQRIVQRDLTPSYLQYKYISSMEKLVGSPNSTFVFYPLDTKLTPIMNMNK